MSSWFNNLFNGKDKITLAKEKKKAIIDRCKVEEDAVDAEINTLEANSISQNLTPTKGGRKRRSRKFSKKRKCRTNKKRC